MQVLVQVYAVGVDAHDIAALDNQGIFDIGKYVPGRSFVGRAVSLGEDESDLRPGDLVMGLMDVRKSGALSEYVLVDRRRVARAPDSSLTLEQLALLPAQGVTALRALHNLPLRVGMRALVMDATAGGAALISQELARLGVAVTAVISGNDETSRVLAHAQCVAYGARAVFLGSPTAVMRRMDEGAFDIVVDTRGGPKIFEAARRILAEGGYLLSLAADGSTRRPKNTGGGRFRAFRRSRINTAFIVPAGMGEPTVDTSGLDPRDIMECPAMANLVPTPTTVVPFERGPEVFARRQGGVVRIVQ